jgi:hypothetical protein
MEGLVEAWLTVRERERLRWLQSCVERALESSHSGELASPLHMIGEDSGEITCVQTRSLLAEGPGEWLVPSLLAPLIFPPFQLILEQSFTGFSRRISPQI